MAYFIVGVFIVCTGICNYFAKKKQLRVHFWNIFGATTGPIAVLCVLLAKSKKPQ
jgi:hypothetical protein